MSAHGIPEYGYPDAAPQGAARYLRGPILELLSAEPRPLRVLDVGCGNGYWLSELGKAGLLAPGGGVGIDPSTQGIEQARRNHPGLRFESLTASDHLLERLGEKPFDVVLSTEVVEHVYEPRQWARGCFNCLKPGGLLVCSTPYHGYLKNLGLSLANKWDTHIDPLWDGGHIKFWSRATLTRLLGEAGFTDLRFRGAGRLAYLWMSMVMAGRRPK